MHLFIICLRAFWLWQETLNKLFCSEIVHNFDMMICGTKEPLVTLCMDTTCVKISNRKLNFKHFSWIWLVSKASLLCWNHEIIQQSFSQLPTKLSSLLLSPPFLQPCTLSLFLPLHPPLLRVLKGSIMPMCCSVFYHQSFRHQQTNYKWPTSPTCLLSSILH